jgi:hypothetical protein
MSFYRGQGDFYRGQGDPGIFDFLKKAAGTAFHFLAPGPLRAGVDAGTGIITHARGKALAARESAAQRGLVTGLVHKHWGGPARPNIRAPFDESGRGRTGKMVRSPSAGTGRRRMNVANVKALRRAIRRLAGFEHLAKSIYSLLRGVAPTPKRKASRRGHGAGCGCPSCRGLLPRGGRGDFYMGDG